MNLKLKKRDGRSLWVVDATGAQVGIVEKGSDGYWRPFQNDGTAFDGMRTHPTVDRGGAVRQIEAWLAEQERVQRRRRSLAEVGLEIRDGRYWYGALPLCVKTWDGSTSSTGAITDQNVKYENEWRIEDGPLLVVADSEPEVFWRYLQHKDHPEVRLLQGWAQMLHEAGLRCAATVDAEGLWISIESKGTEVLRALTVEDAAANLWKVLEKRQQALHRIIHGEPAEDRVSEKEE